MRPAPACQGTVRLRSARAQDAAAVSALALRSKAHWGYSADFLEDCRQELTFDPQACASGWMVVAETGATSVMAGFYALAGPAPRGELTALFVDPGFIGQGLGALLLRHALAHAAARRLTSLVIEADPGAEGFYLHLGARRIGAVASGSIPGRSLPLLEITVTTPPA